MRRINHVTKIVLIFDLVIALAWGLVTPIMAIFIVGSINGGNAEVAGIATGIYWIVKSFLQTPIGNFLDKNHGEKDDFWALFLGTVLGAIAPIGILFSTLPWHLYAWQVFSAVCMAFVIPSWGGIFIRHIGKGQEGFLYGLDSTAIGLGAGIAGVVGGVLAEVLGFETLFIGVAILQLLSGLLLLLIKDDLYVKVIQGLISAEDGRKKDLF
jgi:MFS family permease